MTQKLLFSTVALFLLLGTMCPRNADRDESAKTLHESPSDGDAPQLDILADLQGRHPEVFESAEFGEWPGRKQLGALREKQSADGKLTEVFIENADRSSMFAARLADEGDEKSRLIRSEVINLQKIPITRSQALAIVEQQTADKDITSVSPEVTFDPLGVDWLLETNDSRRYLVDRKGRLTKLPDGVVPPPPAPPASTTTDDSLSDNDLHYRELLKAQAQEWVKGIPATDPIGRARRICSKVYHFVEYSTETSKYHFSWADRLLVVWDDLSTLKLKAKPQGACDEYAIVAVTALRALDIPARLRILKWTRDGKSRAHMCVEFNAGERWVHMDPAYKKVFDAPHYYRMTQKQKNIVVLNADFPSDALSSGEYLGGKDVDDDGILHPYNDFKISTADQGVPIEKYTGQ